MTARPTTLEIAEKMISGFTNPIGALGPALEKLIAAALDAERTEAEQLRAELEQAKATIHEWEESAAAITVLHPTLSEDNANLRAELEQAKATEIYMVETSRLNGEAYSTLAAAERNLRAQVEQLHRWFPKVFGEIMNGRDFDVKCVIAEREVEQLKAEREKGEAKWLPIESAPERVWVHVWGEVEGIVGHTTARARFVPDFHGGKKYWHWVAPGYEGVVENATHWQPLPDPPEAQS